MPHIVLSAGINLSHDIINEEKYKGGLENGGKIYTAGTTSH